MFSNSLKRIASSLLSSVGVLLFAIISSTILCSLEVSIQQELADYEKTYAVVPVEVTVTNLTGNRTDRLQIEGWVGDLFEKKTMQDYLNDVKIKMRHEINDKTCAYSGYEIVAVTSQDTVTLLDPVKGGIVNYYSGYDESMFYEENFLCLIPAWMEDEVKEDGTVTVSLCCENQKTFVESTEGFTFTVAGTFDTSLGESDEKVFYCSYQTLAKIQLRMGCERVIDSISGTLKDNSRLEDFKTYAYSWFAIPDVSGEKTHWGVLSEYYPYAIDINDINLRRVSATLQTSIAINEFSALMVFILTAGAGYFLGFLMVRSRKREIILMRTLGKPNSHIYRDFAMEQMLWVLVGVLAGGAVFLWKPLPRLALFALVYFLGLSGALLLFLHSTLLTTIKEDN